MALGYGKIIALIELFVKKAEEATRLENFTPQTPQTPKSSEGPKSSYPEEEDEEDEERMMVLKAIADNDFNLETLRSLKNNDNISFYIESLLKPVGTGKDAGIGSGRMVFDLGNKVLKYGYNNSGVYQNYQEARIANRNSSFASVYDIGPGAKWIVSEKIRGFSSPDEFRVYTGVPIEAIESSGMIRVLNNDTLQRLKSRYDLEEDALDFVKNFAIIHRNFGTILGDLLNYQHWGVAPDGSVKLYDYGLDKSGYDKMYEGGFFKGDRTAEEAELNKMLDETGVPQAHKNLGVIELPDTK